MGSKRRRARAAPIFLALVLMGVSATGRAAVTKVERVNVSTAGDPSTGEGSHPNAAPPTPSLSADGRFIAFVAAAADLIPNDTNGVADVFLRDRLTGTTERVSVATGGTQANGPSISVSVSADGRFVAFTSLATNLVPGDTNNATDVFLRDRALGTTERVNLSATGEPLSGAASPSLGADGRLVAFAVGYSIYLRDRASQTTEGVAAGFAPRISADGRFVAYLVESYYFEGSLRTATVWDRVTKTREQVAVTPSGGRGAGTSDFSSVPSISADGRYVVFDYSGRDLTPGIYAGYSNIVARDRARGSTEIISVPNSGLYISDGASGSSGMGFPAINADGRYVAFPSNVVGLVPGDGNGVPDILVRDRGREITERVSVAPNGAEANGPSARPAINADGRFVAFWSLAGNLVPGDTNGAWDLFVIERTLAPFPARVAVFRPSTREWYLRNLDGTIQLIQFGGPGDLPVPANYLDDGLNVQIAVFRPATREWFVRAENGTTLGPTPFGGPGDLPVPADYLGIGRAQIAVFRPATRQWFVRGDAGNTVGPFQFGGPGDLPVPANYLGDGRRAQIAVFRPSTGQWFLRSDAGGTVGPILLGGAGALPVPADYLGIGRSQIAVFRPATGDWLIRTDGGQTITIPFGEPGDIPRPGDYLGLGHAQVAVYRPATGEWWLRSDDGAVLRLPWGAPGDWPVSAVYVPRFRALTPD
jgi:Tol biopolymer transport system component